MKKLLFPFLLAVTFYACQHSQEGSKTSTESGNTTQSDTTPIQQKPTFSGSAELLGRHPEIFKNERFMEWNKTYPFQVWHEAEIGSGFSNVIIQSADSKSIIAFKLIHPDKSAHESSPGVITDVRVYDLLEEKNTKSDALELLNTKGFRGGEVISIRPVIDWSNQGSALNWEVKFSQDQTIEKLLVDSVNVRQLDKIKKTDLLQGDNMKPDSNDWLEQNELHHLDAYRTVAERWTKGAKTNEEKAHMIFNKVRSLMTYDGTIKNIGEFTWADELVIKELQYTGICDEWSVVQITMLRAIGIPAVMKFMSFRINDSFDAHACAEWLDGDNWRHMDALWNAFDHPEVYREHGCTDVLVMDANSPRDNRSTADAWSVHDITGDGKLHPYYDYILNPDFPGKAKKGYSF